MGCSSIVMLIAVAFLAGVLSHAFPNQSHNSKITAPYANVVSSSLSQGTAPKSLLRSSDSRVLTGDNNDERATVSGLSKIDNLMQRIRNSRSEKAAVKVRLQSQVHPTQLFRNLHLGEGVAKLDGNQNLAQWFRLVAAYRKKNGKEAFSDLAIYYLLLKTNSEEEVTTLIQSLKNTPGLKKIGASIRERKNNMRKN
ncbi:secreted RxLR effector peptide protein, putative [Phytophthora infestans T30-4]|uniref:Secreted RxLR effector peptide protein, putative n=1 Tax=Phytophthora infestans (strain T30-4) TaxID=403677 RepID=D0MUA9_PHYIT|nr:secreted RxLR effector peptide protein, putative [Phytophthora infestans T30-4]EEY61556.1 secreted RxLR effector peptide protein, putative [Phytophthora infestans T30-4]|eukprot:XP_002908473.1 secreted RxLR effector peptide protein, putative [Phytophthora infestans T30-4]